MKRWFEKSLGKQAVKPGTIEEAGQKHANLCAMLGENTYKIEILRKECEELHRKIKEVNSHGAKLMEKAAKETAKEKANEQATTNS